jgi:hypothetical protein
VPTGDAAALRELVAEDAIFFSPVAHAAQPGRKLTVTYLSVRPLKGIDIVHQKMGEMLQAARKPAA